MMNFTKSDSKRCQNPKAKREMSIENTGKLYVRIGQTGRTEVCESSSETRKSTSLLRKAARQTRRRPILLLLAVLAFALLFLLLTGYGSDQRTGRIMGKKSADYRKICCLAYSNSSDGPCQLMHYVTPDGMVSLAIPSDYKRMEGRTDQVFLSEDNRISILLEVIDTEEAPISLRTLHRLTLENITAELSAVRIAEPRFFITRGGNEAFDTSMKDEHYEYGIVTAASQSRFATVILAAERTNDDALKTQLEDLISATGLSLFVN
jgi:hypothetical protein